MTSGNDVDHSVGEGVMQNVYRQFQIPWRSRHTSSCCSTFNFSGMASGTEITLRIISVYIKCQWKS